MYTTKLFNEKVAPSYLGIGDPYAKAQPADGRTKGKQFMTNPSKLGQLQGYFAPFQYATDSYQDSNKYIVTQPRDARKLGFGTHDANRRDEFTLDIRAKQYREAIHAWDKNEMSRPMRAQTAPVSQSAKRPQSDSLDEFSGKYFQANIPKLQYDIGRSKTGLTPACSKCKHDTFYCIHRLSLMSGDSVRRPDTRTTYSEEFNAARIDSLPPQHYEATVKKSVVRDITDKNPFHARRSI